VCPFEQDDHRISARLLAQEVYDRDGCASKTNRVALVTSERSSRKMHNGICAAEAMPMDREFAFVAIDGRTNWYRSKRGHIFTDRMLHVRGRDETMILGSESLRPRWLTLLPDAGLSPPAFSA
jgi:ATP-dependent RNA helicase SUPV3L1/SUV3